jgi:hypothetical protein
MIISRRTLDDFEWKRFRGNFPDIIHDKKNDSKESHLHFLCFKMPSYEMLPLIFMGQEMILFENSVLKMYLLNTHLKFHINSFNYFILFICFIKQFVISRLISAIDCVSGWYPGWYGKGHVLISIYRMSLSDGCTTQLENHVVFLYFGGCLKTEWLLQYYEKQE